jgi:hypothetical protein
VYLAARGGGFFPSVHAADGGLSVRAFLRGLAGFFLLMVLVLGSASLAGVVTSAPYWRMAWAVAFFAATIGLIAWLDKNR